MTEPRKNLRDRIAVAGVKLPLGDGVNTPVAWVAERDQIGEGVVPLVFRVAKSAMVDVVNVKPALAGAQDAHEPVALKGVQVVSVAVLLDQLGKVGTPRGAVENRRSGALRRCLADGAGEVVPALRAGPASRVSRVELVAAPVAGDRVAFWAAVLVSRLARLAPKLNAIVGPERRAAVGAGAGFEWLFGHGEAYQMGAA